MVLTLASTVASHICSWKSCYRFWLTWHFEWKKLTFFVVKADIFNRNCKLLHYLKLLKVIMTQTETTNRPKSQ